jgi:hypothetical protein
VLPVAIAAVGLIASGALGYLFYSTNNKLEATTHTLAQTQLTLDSTRQQLAAAQSDAATKKVTPGYWTLYTVDAEYAPTTSFVVAQRLQLAARRRSRR